MPPVQKPVGKKPKFIYSEKNMTDAIAAVRDDKLSYKAASKKFGVPRSTLTNKVLGKFPEGRKMGPPSVLSVRQEEELVQWIIKIAKAGFPLVREDLLCTVNKIVISTNRPNPFTNNKPDRKWFDAFLRRHPQLSQRVPEQLTQTRALVSENYIRTWFKEVDNYLKDEGLSHVLLDPTLIFNADETAFSMCPKTGKVIGPKGEKNMYDIVSGSGKESITVLMTIQACGEVAPPLIVYPYVRLPAEVMKSVPDSWGLGKSESGWMTGETFYEYIANVFHPWILEKNITTPAILFIDGHKSHLTKHLSDFCSEHGIILIALPPNTTHILQPCDVSLFKPLKTEWKNVMHSWKLKNPCQLLSKTNFASVFKPVVTSLKPEWIKHGFERSGLYPFMADAVDYSKCRNPTNIATDTNTEVLKDQIPIQKQKKETQQCLQNHLEYLESFISPNILIQFKECIAREELWNGDEKFAELFEVWNKIRIHVYVNSDNASVGFEESDISHIEDTISPISYQADIPIDNFPNQQMFRPTIESSSTTTREQTSTRSILPDSQQPSTSSTTMQLNVAFTDEVSNSSIGSPFKRVLYWPERRISTTKRKQSNEKEPSVVTSLKWKMYQEKKILTKEEKEKEKKIRKETRILKQQAKIEEKNAAKLRKNKRKKQKDNDIESDSESDTSVVYDDSSDVDTSFGENEEQEMSALKFNLPPESLKIEQYYAVYYDELFYIGRIISLGEDCSEVKFLKEIFEGQFHWPKNDDISTISNDFFFHGPITLVGAGPFTLLDQEMRIIKTKYRQFKGAHRMNSL